MSLKLRIKELDALRGIAALLVVFYHMAMNFGKFGFSVGQTGVDMFFIISGFVIFMTLEKTRNWKDFVVSRFSRLYPAYWVSVIITTMAILVSTKYFNLYYFDKEISLIRFLGNMSMFQYFFKIHNIDGPYWTLTVELLFYMVMLFAFVTKALRHIEIIGISLVILIIPYGIYHKTLDSFWLLHKIFVLFPLLNYFPLFFSGIIFYKLKFEKKTLLRYIYILICITAQLILFKEVYMNNTYISFTAYSGMLILYFFLFILFVSNKLAFIVNRSTLFLGKISYSLYLIHQFIGHYILMSFSVNYLNLNFWAALLLITLPVLLLLATLINRMVEVPAMNYIRQIYKSSQNFDSQKN